MSISIKKINNIQKKILEAKKELTELGNLERPLPELIKTTNLLRSNEYLIKVNELQSQLLVNYEQYVSELEKLVLSTNIIKSKIKQLKSRKKPIRHKTSRKRKKITKKRKSTKKRKLKKSRRK